jgi:hypothetical protein
MSNKTIYSGGKMKKFEVVSNNYRVRCENLKHFCESRLHADEGTFTVKELPQIPEVMTEKTVLELPGDIRCVQFNNGQVFNNGDHVIVGENKCLDILKPWIKTKTKIRWDRLKVGDIVEVEDYYHTMPYYDKVVRVFENAIELNAVGVEKSKVKSIRIIERQEEER